MCPGSHFTHDPLRCFQREKNILLNTFSHDDKTPSRNNGKKEAFIILAHSAGGYMVGSHGYRNLSTCPHHFHSQETGRGGWWHQAPFSSLSNPGPLCHLYLGYVFPSQLTQARNCLIDICQEVCFLGHSRSFQVASSMNYCTHTHTPLNMFLGELICPVLTLLPSPLRPPPSLAQWTICCSLGIVHGYGCLTTHLFSLARPLPEFVPIYLPISTLS